VVGSLGERATLHVVEGGDHSFEVLKSSGRDPAQVQGELVTTTAQWIGRVLAGA
jgi:hypothetical protein